MARGKPKGKLSHKECRPKVCIICFGPAERPLSQANEKDFSSLSDFAQVEFKAANTPSGLCEACRQRKVKGKPLNIVHKDFSFINVTAPNSKLPCDCRLCSVVRAPNVKKIKKLGVAKKDYSEKFMMVCMKCGTPLEEAGKKGAHKCTKAVQTKNAIEGVTRTASTEEAVGEKVATFVLRRSKRSPNGTYRLSQPSGGGKLALTKGSAKPPTPKPAMSHKELLEVAIKYGEKEAKRQASFINKKFGTGSVEPHFQKMLHDATRLFSEDMTISQLTFRQGTKGHETDVLRWVIHVNDFSDFTLKVFGERKLNFGNTTCKLGIDKGGGLLKFSLSIIDDLEDPDVKHKSTGVRKIFVVAVVVGVEESHHNFQVILDLIQAHRVACLFSLDMKAVNYVGGLMSNSSSFPCFTCEVPKSDLATSVGPIRTIGNLLSRHEELLTTRQAPIDKKRCKSVENTQLLTKDFSPENLSTPASNFVAPFILHLKTGIFKHLFDWLKALFPNLTQKWTEYVFANQTKYNGGQFIGNDVDNLLENVDFLEPEALKLEGGLAALPYVQALRDFRKVKLACFGRTLNDDYRKIIEECRESILSASLQALEKNHESTKIHYLSWHLADWIRDKSKGKGLSDFCEETPESLHQAFTKKLLQFKCHLGITERDAQNLLRVTVAFNSTNI